VAHQNGVVERQTSSQLNSVARWLAHCAFIQTFGVVVRVVTWAACAETSSAQTFSWSADKEERAIRRIRQFQIQHQLSTVAVGVSIDGEVLFAGNLDKSGSTAPEGTKTRYRIGCVSKQVTAAAILALIEDGTPLPSSGLPFTLDTTLADLAPRSML
jgi:CubicO group peptidase (beta-lactamase class C family)